MEDEWDTLERLQAIEKGYEKLGFKLLDRQAKGEGYNNSIMFRREKNNLIVIKIYNDRLFTTIRFPFNHIDNINDLVKELKKS